MHVSKLEVVQPFQVYRDAEVVKLEKGDIIQRVTYTDGRIAYFMSHQGEYVSVELCDIDYIAEYVESMGKQLPPFPVTEFSIHAKYSIVAPHEHIKLLKFIMNGVIYDEFIDLLLQPGSCATFDVYGNLKQLSNGSRGFAGISYKFTASMLYSLGFSISCVQMAPIILPHLKAVPEEFLSEHSAYTLPKAIKDMYVGDKPVTIEMLQNGFGAKLDNSTGTLYDIVIDGCLVNDGFFDAVITYEDWVSCVVVDEELCTQTTTVSRCEPYVTGDSWTMMLDAFNDENSDELKLRHPEMYSKIHEMVCNQTPYGYFVTNIDYDLCVDAAKSLMKIKYTATVQQKLYNYSLNK